MTAVDKLSSRSPYLTGVHILVLMGLSSSYFPLSTSDGNKKYVKEDRAGVKVSHIDGGWKMRKGGRVEEDGAELKSGIIHLDQY